MDAKIPSISCGSQSIHTSQANSFVGNCLSRESSIDSTADKDDSNKSSSKIQKDGLRQSQENASKNDGVFVIDVDGNRGVSDVKNISCAETEEKMCRVCHMSSECLSQSGDLIHLGCRCKGDLGTAHLNCAELWFAMKGNKFCEICGVAVRNVSGVGDNGFMLESNDSPIRTSYSHTSIEQRYKPICNIVGVFVIMALGLYWLFYGKRHLNRP